jgi:hypothetical protein
MGMWKFARVFAATAMMAATVTAANAAVFPSRQQLPQQVIGDFNKSPTGLLQQFPQGGAPLISRVRDLAASDPSTLPNLIGLLTNSAVTPDQLRAIVAGLAQVARLASKTDQAYADEIQRSIAGTNNPTVIAAYQAATGDVAIAAAGGGGGGGGGSGGGGPTGNGGFVFGGPNGGQSGQGALHAATLSFGSPGTGVGGSSVSVSPH